LPRRGRGQSARVVSPPDCGLRIRAESQLGRGPCLAGAPKRAKKGSGNRAPAQGSCSRSRRHAPELDRPAGERAQAADGTGCDDTSTKRKLSPSSAAGDNGCLFRARRLVFQPGSANSTPSGPSTHGPYGIQHRHLLGWPGGSDRKKTPSCVAVQFRSCRSPHPRDPRPWIFAGVPACPTALEIGAKVGHRSQFLARGDEILDRDGMVVVPPECRDPCAGRNPLAIKAWIMRTRLGRLCRTVGV